MIRIDVRNDAHAERTIAGLKKFCEPNEWGRWYGISDPSLNKLVIEFEYESDIDLMSGSDSDDQSIKIESLFYEAEGPDYNYTLFNRFRYRIHESNSRSWTFPIMYHFG